MAEQLARAGVLDIYVEQGATYRLGFVHGTRTKLDTGETLVSPTDLTGCKARAQLRAAYGEPILLQAITEAVTVTTPVLDADGAPVLDVDGNPTSTSVTTPAGIVIDDATAGHLWLSWTAEQTDTLVEITRAVWDLEIVYPSGDVQRVLQGKVTISPNITR